VPKEKWDHHAYRGGSPRFPKHEVRECARVEFLCQGESPHKRTYQEHSPLANTRLAHGEATPRTQALRSCDYHRPTPETAARSLKVAPIAAPVHSDVEIEAAITALGREPGGGLVCLLDAFTIGHRSSIISAAARNNVPAVYTLSEFVREGGLLSYGVDLGDISRRAATYVDRILRGAKPGDLPVQLPTKFEMAVNLKTAKALGLAVPLSILVRADELIE
jgi:putative ABC transport system substrate-binding protein